MARKFLKFLVVFTAAFVVTFAEEYNYEECFATDRGREYRGTIAVTMDNIPCQRWDTDFAPHDITTYGHGSFPDDTRTDAANYCRNPDNQAGGPWCYTTDPDIRWQTCKVPRCYGRVSFADSQFNFGAESHKGNKVWFVDDIQQYECEIFPDGSNEEMIQCYTPNTMEAGTYYVKVAVNGVPTPNAGLCNNNPKSWSCSLYTNVHYHPYIESVFPSAAPKDSVITVYGRFFTDKYGSNLAEATNGKTEGILRAYVQGKPCELKDGDDFYGISLWNEWANNGYLRCKVSALPVPSNVKVSVIIDAPYGKTLPLPGSYIVSATGKPFMFQTYAEVTGISPTEGSTAGGQLLTITGTGFDDTTSPDVKVGDDECEVVSVTDTEIMCRTPAEHSSVDDSYVGGRGLKNFLFTDDKKNFDDLDDLTARTDHTDMFWSDGAYWCENATQGIHDKCSVPPSSLYNVRTIGYLTPKITGDYRFYIKCDDAAKLYLSTSARVADKVSLSPFITFLFCVLVTSAV
ncbi:PKHD1L1 [Bugula neritina]|uniref:PKHD1L1 n=1 Tax=Bugula neritina TaxID=10212 RepID=A0A7J7K7Q2_BUGNE|nr:PKHD1L1 [Bugula neritina]